MKSWRILYFPIYTVTSMPGKLKNTHISESLAASYNPKLVCEQEIIMHL